MQRLATIGGMHVQKRSRVAFIRLKHRVPADVRVRARTALFATPRLSAASWAVLDPRTRANRIDARTEVVLDGYHRSANTFAKTQFQLANPDVQVSSHMHNPSAIIIARRRRIPAVVLIRDPYDAVPSLLQFMVGVSPANAIRMWTRYYSVVEPYLDEVVVVDFEEAIAGFGDAVRRCNTRWGTDFVEPPASPEFQGSVRARINKGWEGNPGVPLPSRTRRSSASIREELLPADRAALEGARDLYVSIKCPYISPYIS
jgi:hypothetical protein